MCAYCCNVTIDNSVYPGRMLSLLLTSRDVFAMAVVEQKLRHMPGPVQAHVCVPFRVLTSCRCCAWLHICWRCVSCNAVGRWLWAWASTALHRDCSEIVNYTLFVSWKLHVVCFVRVTRCLSDTSWCCLSRPSLLWCCGNELELVLSWFKIRAVPFVTKYAWQLVKHKIDVFRIGTDIGSDGWKLTQNNRLLLPSPLTAQHVLQRLSLVKFSIVCK